MSESEQDASPALGICDLPKDVIYDILARADPRGACALASACRRLRALTSLPGAEVVWRDLARRAGAWRHCAPERYLVLDGEKRRAKERDSLLSSYMRGGAASARRRDGRGAWRALCGRGNHLSYTEDLVVELPVRVSERDFVFETTLALGGRRFVLRAYSAEPHVEEEDAGTLHPSYGAALCVELELTNGEGGDGGGEGDGEGSEDEGARTATATRRKSKSADGAHVVVAPMSAHLLFQVLRREDPDDEAGASRSAPSLDPLTGVARLVTFQRFDVEDDGGAEILRLSRCVPCSALHSKSGRFVFRDGDDGEETYRLRLAALLHEDEEAADSVPGWRRAGKPRGPADVAGARAPLLEHALTSPEASRRRIALEMYLLWYTMEGVEVTWRRSSWYGRIGGGRVGASTDTARLGAGSGTSPERAAHNVQRVLTTSMLRLLFDDLRDGDGDGGGDDFFVARTAAMVLSAYAESEVNAAAMIRAGGLGKLREAHAFWNDAARSTKEMVAAVEDVMRGMVVDGGEGTAGVELMRAMTERKFSRAR
jgi:hypothetical protein